MIKEHNESVFSIRTASGQAIHCVLNQADGHAPLVVLAPPFEGTIRTMLMPMLYLINNGFSTLRFDFTEHLGNSDGAFVDWTMSSALEDLAVVMAHARSDEKTHSASSVVLLTVSISSRLAYRYLAEQPNAADLFVSVFGCVNMRDTILAANPAAKADAFAYEKDTGLRYGKIRIMHHYADVDRYFRDLIDTGMHNLEGTLKDVAAMRTPTILIMSEMDKWVSFAETRAVFSTRPDLIVDAYRLPNAGHELYKNPEAAKETFRAATRALRKRFGMQDAELVEPTLSEVIGRNSDEREREKKYASSPLIGSESFQERSQGS